MLKKISRAIIYALIFILPLFTLPFTGNVLDFQKQFLMIGMLALAVILWVWDAVNDKKISLNTSGLNYFVVGFLALVLLSSLFSLYSYGSLWGVPLTVQESFLSTLGLALFFFLVINLFDRSDIRSLTGAAIISLTVAAVYAIFQFFGLYLLPLDYAKAQSFNTIGSLGGLSLLMAVALVLALPVIFSKKATLKWIMIACAAILALALALFNYLVAWIALAVGGLVIFLFAMANEEFSQKNRAAKILPILAIFASLIFISFDLFAKDVVVSVYKALPAMPLEISLSHQATTNIALGTLRQSAKNFFLGSGPGTFIYDFYRFKPAEMSLNNYFWNASFSSGSSEALDRLVTTGLLGLLMIILIIVVWTAKGFKMLIAEKNDAGSLLAIFAAWIAAVLMLFLYIFSLTAMFFFWLLLSLVVVWDENKRKNFDLKTTPLMFGASLALVAALALGIGLLVFGAKRYYAEAQYLGAANAMKKNDINGALQALTRAMNATDGLQDNYLTDLSQIYLAKAKDELSKDQNTNQQDALKNVAPYINSAITASKMVTEKTNPNSSLDWSSRGFVYRQLVGVADQADALSLSAYQRAVALEPSNPYLWTEIGQLYLVQKDSDKAIQSFNKAIAINPNYSNAHYFLGLIDDQQGNKDAAISEFTIISQLNPDNQDIAKMLDNLKQGKPLAGDAAQTQSAQTPATAAPAAPAPTDQAPPAGGNNTPAPGAQGAPAPANGPAPAGTNKTPASAPAHKK